MSDGIHIPRGTAGEKPGRTLRNLKEPWEPLRPQDRLDGAPGTVVDGGLRAAPTGGEPVPIRSGTSTYRTEAGGRIEDVVADGKPGREVGQLWRGWRNLAEKSDDVCRHNGLFVAIPTVAENRDGIRQAVSRVPHPHPSHRLGVAVVTQNGGIGVGTPCRCRSASCLPPSGCSAGRPRLRASALGASACHGAPRCATVPAPLRYAAGHLGDRGAAMAYTRRRTLAL